MQHLSFSSSTSTGLKGKVELKGLIYATPFPMIVFLGVKVVLPGLRVSDTTPFFLGKIQMLFLATKGIEICWMYSLFSV